MKKTLLALAFVSSIAGAVELKTDAQKVGYAFGLEVGASIRAISEDGLSEGEQPVIELEAAIAGIRDAYDKKESQLKPEEIEKVMNDFSERQMKKFEAEMEKQKVEQEAKGKAAAEAGKKFLDENKTKDGVKVTDSGLQYKVITEGTGEKPTAESVVSVHYEGKNLDGKVFDSSYERKEPTEFPLNVVIPGWTEGLQLMSVGSKYEFFIPAELAYGDNAVSEDIPPNSTLLFTVELLGIKKPEEAAKSN